MRLVSMHSAVMNELHLRTANKSEYVRERVVEVDDDPVIAPVIEALDAYGRMGRSYYLDEPVDGLPSLSRSKRTCRVTLGSSHSEIDPTWMPTFQGSVGARLSRDRLCRRRLGARSMRSAG